MYEYKFVEADLGGFFTESNHREIIEQYAQEGWRVRNGAKISINNG